MEFEKWRGAFSVDAEGTTENEVQDGSQGLLFDFVEYIKVIYCVLSLNHLRINISLSSLFFQACDIVNICRQITSQYILGASLYYITIFSV